MGFSPPISSGVPPQHAQAGSVYSSLYCSSVTPYLDLAIRALWQPEHIVLFFILGSVLQTLQGVFCSLFLLSLFFALWQSEHLVWPFSLGAVLQTLQGVFCSLSLLSLSLRLRQIKHWLCLPYFPPLFLGNSSRDLSSLHFEHFFDCGFDIISPFLPSFLLYNGL